MSRKTTSSTIPLGPWTYIFLNRPETKHIDYIRFKIPTQAETGIIGVKGTAVPSIEGPIDTTTFGGQKHIRLFYISDDNIVSEAKLPDADRDDTDPKNAWILPADDVSDLKFEKDIQEGTRTVDENVFLSASINSEGYPVVTFKAKAGKKQPTQGFIQYCAWDGNKWKTEKLDIPKA
jgi:hypothetical protein